MKKEVHVQTEEYGVQVFPLSSNYFAPPDPVVVAPLPSAPPCVLPSTNTSTTTTLSSADVLPVVAVVSIKAHDTLPPPSTSASPVSSPPEYEAVCNLYSQQRKEPMNG